MTSWGEFCQTFEAATLVLQGVLEHKGVFINRLRSEIREDVQLVMPCNLEGFKEYA